MIFIFTLKTIVHDMCIVMFLLLHMLLLLTFNEFITFELLKLFCPDSVLKYNKELELQLLAI